MRRSVLLAASWLVLLAFAYQDVGAEQMLDGRFLSPAYRADPVAMDFATAELISLNQPPDEMDFPPTYVS
ncbi:MAG: hypothetical protein JJ992_14850, partial [Planctomycetes bacterium]|nr:hypothetical protein [Planctomycetota bacterium]